MSRINAILHLSRIIKCFSVQPPCRLLFFIRGRGNTSLRAASMQLLFFMRCSLHATTFLHSRYSLHATTFSSVEDSLESSEVFCTVVVIQYRKDDFHVRMSKLGESLLKALCHCVGALAKSSTTPGGQHEVSAPLHESCVEKETNEPFSIWS